MIMYRLVKASLQMVPGRKTKYDVISGEVGVDMAWQPLLPNPGSPKLPIGKQSRDMGPLKA